MAESHGDRLREEISASDEEIRGWIAHRMNLVMMLHIWKHENDLPIYDAARESQIIAEYIEDFGEEDGEKIARAIIGNFQEG